MTHLKMKATVKAAFNAQELTEEIAFKQEYKKALRQQNKTFKQNGKACYSEVKSDRFVVHFAEKNIGLNRENAILLNKLVDIS